MAVYLFHALRRTELAALKVCNLQKRRGVLHFKVAGKGAKTQFVPAHPAAAEAIDAYLEAAGHGGDRKGALFRPIQNNRTGTQEKAISGDGVYRMVKAYAAKAKVHVDGLCLQALRATAATNALEQKPTSASSKSGWTTPTSPRHAVTTGGSRDQEDSPTFRASY